MFLGKVRWKIPSSMLGIKLNFFFVFIFDLWFYGNKQNVRKIGFQKSCTQPHDRSNYINRLSTYFYYAQPKHESILKYWSTYLFYIWINKILEVGSVSFCGIVTL